MDTVNEAKRLHNAEHDVKIAKWLRSKQALARDGVEDYTNWTGKTTKVARVSSSRRVQKVLLRSKTKPRKMMLLSKLLQMCKN